MCGMEGGTLATFVFMAMISEMLSVEITSISVPGVVEVGTKDIVLDCDFEYSQEEELELEIKWYFNKEPFPIYQWVPSRQGPQIISEKFRDHLDLAFEVNQDKFKKHRALHIINPLPEFSGTYKCKVSSLIDEDFNQKELLVWAPPKSIEFDQIQTSFDDPSPLNVTCLARGMYPAPQAKLTWVYNETSKFSYDGAVTKAREDGLIDVSLTTTIDKNQLAVQVTIGCEISLPGTEYSIQEHTVFYPKGSGAVNCFYNFPLTVFLLAFLHGLWINLE